MVNGQQIGTYQHNLDAGVENGGSSEDYILAPSLFALAGGVIAGVKAGVESVGEALLGNEARMTVGETTAAVAKGTGEALLDSRPQWAKTPGGFVNWLKNLQRAGKALSSEEANAVISEAKNLGVNVRLDPPHLGTNWNVPHLNIGSSGQVHLEVPSGYSNPGVSVGHP